MFESLKGQSGLTVYKQTAELVPPMIKVSVTEMSVFTVYKCMFKSALSRYQYHHSIFIDVHADPEY